MVSLVDQHQPEIVFFDLETTIPSPASRPYAILEFASIIVCPKKLTELDTYETLVKPLDLSLISAWSISRNGITADHVVSSPVFSDIADKVYNILHGRVWAGHNIVEFDCVRLKEAYGQINKPPPVPKRTIDTLKLLTQRFGRRAGDMKMASLAAYFGLGQQSHRSLGDVRMNIEVFKSCATVLFLESSQQDTENNRASLNATTINTCKRKCTLDGASPNPLHQSSNARPDPLHTGRPSAEESSTTTLSNAFSNHAEFIHPDSVSMASITVIVAPFVNGPNRIKILHRDIPLQIHCDAMRVRFGLNIQTQDVDHSGNQRLSFVVNADSSNLCNILEACDKTAKRFVDLDENSQWKPVISRKPGFQNYSPPVRLHLPTSAEDTSTWITEIYYKNSSLNSCSHQLVSSRFADVAEVDSLLRPDSLVDAYFSLDPYNYQQYSGIRLVAKKLIIHTI